MAEPMNEQPPAWFQAAIDTEPESYSTDVDGCRISYRAWGPTDAPAIVLVHGGAAHSGWWDHIAPLIDNTYRVLALDLSGHGDSGRREEYSVSQWAREAVALTAAADLAGPPIMVGHSMGGRVVVTAAAEHPDDVAGIIVIDTPIRDIEPEARAARERTAFGPLRVYPSVDEALSHFRPVPEQKHYLPYVFDHIALASIGAVGGGWTWKFDPRIFDNRPLPAETLRTVRCRVAVFRAEHGLLTADIGDHMYEMLGRVAPVIEIPLAGHHVMLDQPLPLVTGIRTLLADWQHSLPRTRAALPG
jgi:pimeloyl-ACP methyl ester carboxylesterase